MALINCAECGKEVSDKAKTCPHCGSPLGTTEEEPRTEQKQSEFSSKIKQIGVWFKELGWLWSILSLVVPVLGIVWFFKQKKTSPLAAKAALVLGIVSGLFWISQMGGTPESDGIKAAKLFNKAIESNYDFFDTKYQEFCNRIDARGFTSTSDMTQNWQRVLLEHIEYVKTTPEGRRWWNFFEKKTNKYASNQQKLYEFQFAYTQNQIDASEVWAAMLNQLSQRAAGAGLDNQFDAFSRQNIQRAHEELQEASYLTDKNKEESQAVYDVFGY